MTHKKIITQTHTKSNEKQNKITTTTKNMDK